MDESEKTSLTSLTSFRRQDRSLAERFVDELFSDALVSVREQFSKSFSAGDYLPDFADVANWADEVLDESGFEPLKTCPELHLVSEIWDQCKAPYRKGQMSLDEAKSKAIPLAEAYFRGTEYELMYDKSPTRREWHATHINEFAHKLSSLLDDYLCERKELETGKYAVSDYFVSRDENEREIERKRPILTALDLGVKIGFLYRDAWWKFNHEEAAQKYYAQAKSREEGAHKGAKATAEKAAALRSDCLKYVATAYDEKGAAFLGANLSVKAQTISEIALRDRPGDFVGPQGKPLSHKWFLETLESFEADSQLGEAIESAVKNRA